jgi:hypothetical protein
MRNPLITTVMLIEILRSRNICVPNDEVYDMVAERLEDLLKENSELKNHWHDYTKCTDRYNSLVSECNEWEDLCDSIYDGYDCDPQVEIKYLRLKGMHKNEE